MIAVPIKPLKVHKVYSKEDFLSHFQGDVFLKYLKDGNKHNGFTYKPGELNTDPLKWYPSGTCSRGGLYFTNALKIGGYRGSYGPNLMKIEIPDGEQIYVEESKYKIHSLIMSKDPIDEERCGDTNGCYDDRRTISIAVETLIDQTIDTITNEQLPHISSDLKWRMNLSGKIDNMQDMRFTYEMCRYLMNKNTVTKVIDFSGKDLSGSELMMLFQMCGKNYRMNNRKEKKDWTFKFIGSILDSVDFSGSVLGDNCDFTNASIDSALFTDTKVKFANWTGVDTEAAIDFGVK